MTALGVGTSTIAERVPHVSVIVLAYGAEPWLERCVRSALDSERVRVEVVLVDNGAPAAVVSALEELAGVHVLRPGHNTGFAGGCNLGARHAQGDVLVLLNDDAVVQPTALAVLAERLEDPSVGLACASVRLAEQPSTMNTAGNPLHFSGLSWAGSHGQPAERHAAPREVTIAAGTCLAVRRATWDRLGGLWEELFAYHEDVDISWRCWQQGLRCVYVPDALALHRYEFSRNARKQYLLERNRLLFVLTTYGARTLAVLAPALLVVELAVLALSAREGWLPQKLAGYGWLLRHPGTIRRRRARVQADRLVDDRDLAHRLDGRLDPTNIEVTPAARLLSSFLERYWRLAQSRIVRR